MILGEVDLRRTVRDISLPAGSVYGSHDVIEGAAIRQRTARESVDITLRGRWHQEVLPIWPTRDAVQGYVASGEIVDLEFANGDVWAGFVVQRITLASPRMLPDETWISCDFEIALLDPGSNPDILIAAPKPIASAGASGARTDAPIEDRSTPAGDATAAQIARRA